MRISEKGIEFIMREEGEILTAYLCPAKIWTIGVGHTGKDVKKGMKITKEQSRELLKLDIKRFEDIVNKSIRVTLKQCEFDALVSFTFNVGEGAFSKSALVNKINSSASLKEIETQFRRWIYGGGKVLQVLQGRREREIKLYKGE
ncbi:lysozyme [Fusobacterium ulcerans]|uniref:lysozyme n=1 Tax=Fusobacterium ulcerans TaxID=861 RepID=UPI003FED59AF